MQLAIAFLFLISILFHPLPTEAADQACCTSPFKYNRTGDNCVRVIGFNQNETKPIECGAGEACFSSGIFDTTGVCTAPANVGGSCCTPPYQWNIITEVCHNTTTVQDQAPQCASGQYCYDGTCITGSSQQTSVTLKKVCDAVPSTLRGSCADCMDKGAAWTAIGCIDPSDPGTFIATFLNFGIGIAGGIAFLLILIGGFQTMTSAGNPEQLNAGKELMGSAITGLFLIIFSVFILRVIGVNVLGLPGFQ